jgi:hypothetical protein
VGGPFLFRKYYFLYYISVALFRCIIVLIFFLSEAKSFKHCVKTGCMVMGHVKSHHGEILVRSIILDGRFFSILPRKAVHALLEPLLYFIIILTYKIHTVYNVDYSKVL